MRRRPKTAADTSLELQQELDEALSHPNPIFGYGTYGNGLGWIKLDQVTGGLQPYNMAVLAARPKRGKSMLAAGWVPTIAYQAMLEDQVVRVVTLEMRRKSYQRRMASIMARITDPMNIRRGMLTPEEVERYQMALNELAMLPIEYLSNEVDLTEEEALREGNSPVTFDEMAAFIRGVPARRGDPAGKQTYWWLLDHIGLLSDLSASGDREGNVTASIARLANRLADLSHTVASGMVITHLTRLSVGGMPSIESISGSDQVGRNADQIFLLSRPYMDVPDLSEEDREAIRYGEPAFLQIYSRDEGSGLVVLWWSNAHAAFEELPVEPGKKLTLPKSKKAK